MINKTDHMKNILIAAGIVGTAAAGVLLYLRNRNSTARDFHRLADTAGNAHDGVRRYFRKANMEAKRDFEDAIA
jgi:hypothetical protein